MACTHGNGAALPLASAQDQHSDGWLAGSTGKSEVGVRGDSAPLQITGDWLLIPACAMKSWFEPARPSKLLPAA